jgi:hypothetical protein
MDMSRDANVYETDVSYYSCGFIKAANEYKLGYQVIWIFAQNLRYGLIIM